MVRNGCPADLTDAQWAVLEPLLPQPWTGHPRTRDLRQILNGILYELRSGCAWRLVPNEFGPWVTVYYYFRKWRDDGTRNDRLTTAEREELAALRRENRDLRRPTEILKAASVPFPRELDQPRPR